MINAKLRPNILNGSGEKVVVVVVAIFSNGGYVGFSNCLNFTILKPLRLFTLRVKFVNYGLSGLSDVIYMNINAWDDVAVNGRMDNWFDGRTGGCKKEHLFRTSLKQVRQKNSKMV